MAQDAGAASRSRTIRIRSGSALEAGCMELEKPSGAAAFIKACGKLRFWGRADKVKQV